ncbi:unnamed protein product [Nesidiocoris tenuis]|uniref:Uncharacterized protein n=1 Tax=Nesidiocoris tenuis TaxID=355587 RepID=A0A6H5GXS0_9HEMI|nr:unnamed protein product [Nesidiocoris tenuis]
MNNYSKIERKKTLERLIRLESDLEYGDTGIQRSGIRIYPFDIRGGFRSMRNVYLQLPWISNILGLKDYVREALQNDAGSRKRVVDIIKMILYIFSMFVKAYEDKLSQSIVNYIPEVKHAIEDWLGSMEMGTIVGSNCQLLLKFVLYLKLFQPYAVRSATLIAFCDQDFGTECPSTQNVSVQDVMVIITKLIQQKHFAEAYSCLRRSQIQWPEGNELR